MRPPYVDQQEGAYYVSGTRVSLDSIVYAFVGGQTAESIAQAFLVLSLEQVYGAITFYLAHREEASGVSPVRSGSGRRTAILSPCLRRTSSRGWRGATGSP